MPALTVTRTILIEGMTCAGCESRIESKLLQTRGIVSAKVSYAKGTAVVKYESDIINLQQIEAIIKKLNYRIKNPKEPAGQKIRSSDFKTGRLLGFIVIFLAIYMISDRLGILALFNYFPAATENMGYAMLFITGLLTSLHCVAMCGGICLSQCLTGSSNNSSYSSKNGSNNGSNSMKEENSRFSALRPSFLYNIGRVASYTVTGAIVGAIGSVFGFSGSLKGIVQIAAGIFIIIIGLNMLNLFPWLKRLNIRMPKIFTKDIYSRKEGRSPLYIGLLNGLMPCGPLQAMQLYALSTGSPVKGAAAMLIFSLGTVPLMFVFGALSSLLSRKFTGRIMTAGAILVVVMGVFMLSSGVSLSGIALPSAPETVKKPASGNVASVYEDYQTVVTELSPGRYEPITVQKGIPVKWVIKAGNDDINGCNYRLIIPKLGLAHDFTPGDNVIEFTPQESGTIGFSCWMGMIRSRITVVDDINS